MKKQIILTTVMLMFLASSKILAGTLFDDSFTVSGGGGDINYNYNEAGRQTGTVGPLQYAIVGGTLVTNEGATAGIMASVGATTCEFSPNYNFTDSGNFSIEYELIRLGNGNWASVEFGHNVQNTAPWSPDGGMSIRFEENGSYVVQDGWPDATGAFNFTELSYASSPTLKVRVVVSQPDFTGANDAQVALFVNDKAYPIYSSSDLRPRYIYTKTGGFTNNYVSLLGFDADFEYDNFKVLTPGSYDFETDLWTGDADSEISAAKTYSHTICLGTNDDVTVNSVTLTGTGTAMSGTGWDIDYPLGIVLPPVNCFGAWGLNPTITPSSRDLVQDVFYDWTADSSLTLSGLTPGQQYIFTSYTFGIGAVDGRNQYFANSDGAAIKMIDMNALGDTTGQLLSYRYTAPNSGIFSISGTATNLAQNAQWGWFAFTNEEIPEPGLIIGCISLIGLAFFRRK